MSREPTPEGPLLDLADRVREVLAREGIATAVIGAVALAAHGAPRATIDVDLATCMDVDAFWRTVRAIRDEGCTIDARVADSGDPLGGVIDIALNEDMRVQVVNFLNPLGRSPAASLAREAIEGAQGGLIEGTTLRVVPPEHLAALKVYAGGAKSKIDVIELITRRPEILPALRDVCARHGLAKRLQALLDDLARP